MLLMTLPLLAALAGTDTTVAVSPGDKLELRNREGAVTIRVWDRQAVRVQAEHDDDTSVRVDVVGGIVHVMSRSRYGPERVSYQITVPAAMALDLYSQEGDVSITGSRADVEVQSVDGGITLEGGRGTIRLRSVEGDVRVRGASGRLSLATVDGGIEVSGADGELEATAVDGDIVLDGARATSVDASTVDGDITMTGELREGGHYRLSSHDGDVTLTVPSIDAQVTVSTFEGSFTSDFPVTMKATGRKMSFTLGRALAQVDLESFDGEVSLRRGTKR